MNIISRANYKFRNSLGNVALMLLLGSLTLQSAHALNTDEFIEIDSENFQEMMVGNTITGKYAGGRYYDHYVEGGLLTYTWDGNPSKGKWELGENNCVLLTQGGRTKCWVLLSNPVDGSYFFALKKKSGKYHSAHPVKILQGKHTG